MGILREAVTGIRGNWTQGGYRDDKGYCALGHVARVEMMAKEGTDIYGFIDEHDFSVDPAVNHLVHVIREQFLDRIQGALGGHTVVVFNDHADTTEDDVIMVFEKAAALEEEAVL